MKRKVESLRGLGLVASGKRKILDGKAFDKMFPKPAGTDPLLSNDGSTYDTVEFAEKIIRSTLNDTKAITNFLLAKTKGRGTEAFLREVFNFMYKHYQYEVDEHGEEQLRRPARAWKDRGNDKGIDCDCFSISVSSILTNAGIEHSLRIVKMYKRDYYQHIYVVVPKSKGADMRIRKNYWVIDPVLDTFDGEAPELSAITDKKIIMTAMAGIPIRYLNGTENETLNVTGLGHLKLGEEFNGLGDGLGDSDADLGRIRLDFLRRNKRQLINTRDYIRRHPHMVSPIYQPKVLAGMYDTLIGAYDDEVKREAVLQHLSNIEETALQPHLQGLGNLIHSENDDDLAGIVNESIEGLGRSRKKAGGKKKAGIFTKHKNANKHSKGKGKKFLKKLAKGVLQKYNPAFITIRAGFLAAMKTNALRIASRVYWATQPKEVALKAGVTASFYDKAVKGLEFLKKTFVKRLGGDESKVLKAITTGRAAKIAKKLASKGKLTGIDELMGVSGLGVVTAAAVGTAMTFLTTIAATLRKLMGKKGDDAKEEGETGGETDATDPGGNAFTQSDAGNDTAPGDNSQGQYVRLKNQSGNSNSDSGDSSAAAVSDEGGSPNMDDESDQGGKSAGKQSESSAADDQEDKPGMSTGLKIGLAAGGAALLFAGAKMMGGKSKSTAGISGPAKKPASKKAKKVSKVSLT